MKFLKSNEIFVIAEIGVNHNGNHDLAILMTELAIKSGANAVKHQLFDPNYLVSENAPMADYQSRNTKRKISQREMLSELTISLETLRDCKKICDKNNVLFLCTAFDSPSLKSLIELGVECLKWPSGEITNIPFLKEASSYDKPIILSTGMANEEEVDEAINTMISNGMSKKDIIILHCTSQYPAPDQSSNIASIPFMRERFDLQVGFSDHTLGSKVAEYAVSAGARVFEKHITLSKSMHGPDQKASMNIEEFSKYISDLNNALKIYGKFEKKCSSVELSTKDIARKSIHTLKKGKKGDFLKEENLIIQRPGDGIEPKYLKEVMKKRLKRTIPEGAKLLWDYFEE
tara:strand:- start:235 stop:1269 length:1035 start_codon:yes stop_codon:yes gene_type:complete